MKAMARQWQACAGTGRQALQNVQVQVWQVWQAGVAGKGMKQAGGRQAVAETSPITTD